MLTSRDRTPESRHGTRRATRKAQFAHAADLDPTAFSNTAFGDDLLGARWDLDFYSERFLGITPHPGQKRLWRTILLRDESGWRPRYLDIDCSAGNRAGKTLGVSIPLLHNTMFKIGLPPPNPLDERDIMRWATLAFEAYHFGIAQEIAELAFIEITRILSGTHEAQKHGCPLTDEVGGDIVEWTKKYRGEYLWMQVHPAFGGGNIHFRTTGERAIGSLGKDMNLVSYDEAGFDPHFPFITEEVLNMRRLSTGGQLWCIGTATEGINHFADHWERGNPEAPDKMPDAYSIRISTRENIGFGIDQQMFDRIVGGMDPALVPQNIDGFFIQGRHAFFASKDVDEMFDRDLPEMVPAIKGHSYIQGVDPALSFDSTWGIVLDVRPDGIAHGVLAVRHRGRSTGLTIAALAENNHRAYSTPYTRCITGIDATGFGGKMFRDLLSIPVRSVEFGGTRGKKLKLLNDLKWFIENHKLRFPRTGPWLELRRQLLGYRLDDRAIEQDAVMALAVACTLMRRNPGGNVSSLPFDYFHPDDAGVSLRPQVVGQSR